MDSKLLDMLGKRVDDECGIVRRYRFQGFLDHVVGVLVLNGLDNVVPELESHGELRRGVALLKKLLDNPAAVRLERERHDVPFHNGRDPLDLGGRPYVEELLDNVIAEDVGHEHGAAVANLVEKALPRGGRDGLGAPVESLLDET